MLFAVGFSLMAFSQGNIHEAKTKYLGQNILYDRFTPFGIKEDPKQEIFEPKYKDENIYKVVDVVEEPVTTIYTPNPNLFLVIEKNGEEKKISFYPPKYFKIDSYTLQKDYDEYINKYHRQKKDASDKYRREHDERMAEYYQKKNAEDAVKLKEYTKKYGLKTAQKIIEGDVWIGMTREMLLASKGDPKKVNTFETAYSYQSQYIFEDSIYGTQYIYLENGKVTAIQDY